MPPYVEGETGLPSRSFPIFSSLHVFPPPVCGEEESEVPFLPSCLDCSVKVALEGILTVCLVNVVG